MFKNMGVSGTKLGTRVRPLARSSMLKRVTGGFAGSWGCCMSPQRGSYQPPSYPLRRSQSSSSLGITNHGSSHLQLALDLAREHCSNIKYGQGVPHESIEVLKQAIGGLVRRYIGVEIHGYGCWSGDACQFEARRGEPSASLLKVPYPSASSVSGTARPSPSSQRAMRLPPPLSRNPPRLPWGRGRGPMPSLRHLAPGICLRKVYPRRHLS
jgi:hypothetical protein